MTLQALHWGFAFGLLCTGVLMVFDMVHLLMVLRKAEAPNTGSFNSS